MKKPKHSEFIHAYADGVQIQRRNESFESCDCGPEWIDLPYHATFYDHAQYRVKPKEYPKTTLPSSQLATAYNNSVNSNVLLGVANAAIKEFITSGEMDKYIKENK